MAQNVIDNTGRHLMLDPRKPEETQIRSDGRSVPEEDLKVEMKKRQVRKYIVLKSTIKRS